MKRVFVGFLFLIASSISFVLSSCAETPITDNSPTRIYFLYPNFNLDDSIVELSADILTKTGKKSLVLAQRSFSPIPVRTHDMNSRIYFFDVPSNTESLVFYHTYLASGNKWSESNVIPFKANHAYICDTTNYLLNTVYSTSSFVLGTECFAGYILNSVDETNPSKCNGYNEYDYLNSVFYRSLLDYSVELGDEIILDDPSTESVVSFNEKWLRIKNNRKAHDNTIQKTILLSIECLLFFSFAVPFLIAPLYLLVKLIRRGKRKKHA